MPFARRRPWLIAAVALLSATGVWLGHTLEYVRVWGTSGLERELVGSVHLYMVPAGLALILLLGAGWAAIRRVHARLGERAARAGALLAGPWRSAEPAAQAGDARGRSERPALAIFLMLGTALAVLQVALYLVQENTEATLAHLPAPGLAAISGVHWAAPLLQAVTAFSLAAVATCAWALVRRHAERVENAEQVVRRVLAVVAARRARSIAVPAAPRRLEPLTKLLGSSIWCRPPPLALIP